FHPHIERLQGQRIIFVRTGGKSQVAISLTEIGFKLYCRLEFLLRLCELLLFDQRLAQTLMKRRIVGTAREKPAISRLALIIFLGNHVEISEIALQRNICRSQLLARLQFGNRLVVLTVRRQHAPQLDTRVSLLGMRRHKFFQLRFSFRHTVPSHVDIGQSRQRIGRRTQRECLLVFALRVCKLVLFFQQRSRSQMWLGILWLQRCRLPVVGNGFLGLGRFEHMREGNPGPRMALGNVTGGLELRGGQQVLRGLGLSSLGKLQPQIQIRLQNIRLRRYRFAVRRNRFVPLAQPILHKPQFKPRHIIRGIVPSIPLENLPQQRLGPGVILFLNQRLSLRQFRRWRVFLGNRGVMSFLAGSRARFVTHAGRRAFVLRSRIGLRRRRIRSRRPGECRKTRCQPRDRESPSDHEVTSHIYEPYLRAMGTRVSISVQDTRQILSRIRPRQLRDRFRRPSPYHLAPTASALWPQIDHPIRSFDHFQIVLDDHNRSPCFNQTPKGRQKFADVVKMQPRCRLVENVQQPPLQLRLGPRSPARFTRRRLQMLRQLHALRLAARKRRRRLPQPQISQPNFLQRPQLLRDLWHFRKKLQSFLNGEVQNFVNVLPAIPHVEHGWLIARPLTLLANQFDVGQELHLHRDRAVALACLTTPARNVERKMSRPESALLRLGQGSEQFADRVKRLDIRHRIRPRRPSNRRLVDQHHFLNKLIALQTLPTRGRPRRSAARLLLRLRQSPV